MALEQTGRPCVGVTPASAFRRRPRLFSALASAFRVEFAPFDGVPRAGLAAVLAFGTRAAAGLPALELREDDGRDPGRVRLHAADALDRRLRGAVLGDRSALGPSLEPRLGDVVLASCDGALVWLLAGDGLHRTVAWAPAELTGTRSLRDQFVDGDFLGLLAIVELLRSLGGDDGWTPPPPRASFVLDDPNLHRPTYGWVRFRELAGAAAEHGYHVAVATIPADQWLVNRRAAAIFRSAGGLSLALHGNSHVRRELGRGRSAADREALVAQALRRIASLERRTGLQVSRVMVAPHESCRDEMFETLARGGVEALCYGWGERSRERPLADWAPVDLRGGGLPVLPRRPLLAERGELALRAYLDQPLVLSLHHGDLADGLGVLADAAAEIDRIAAPQWGSLGAIAGAGVATRVEGAALHVRPYGRRCTVAVPAGVERLEVELPPSHPSPDGELLVVRRSRGGEERSFAGHAGAVLSVTGGEVVEVRLRRVDAFEPLARPVRRTSPWAFQRRLLAESRDRLSAFVPRGLGRPVT